jgi:transposase-like protein
VLPVPFVSDGRTIREDRQIPPDVGTGSLIPVTNAIEALNAKLRRAVRARGHFPTDEAAMKLLFLVLNRTEREWKMPPREWSMAKAQFAILFGERFTRAMA